MHNEDYTRGTISVKSKKALKKPITFSPCLSHEGTEGTESLNHLKTRIITWL